MDGTFEVTFIELVKQLNECESFGEDNQKLNNSEYWEIFKWLFSDLIVYNCVGFDEDYEQENHLYKPVDPSHIQIKRINTGDIDTGTCFKINDDGKTTETEQFISSDAISYLLNKTYKHNNQVRSGKSFLQMSFLKNRINPYVLNLNKERFYSFKERVTQVLKSISAYPDIKERERIVKCSQFKYDDNSFNVLFNELVLKMLKPHDDGDNEINPDDAIALLFILALYPNNDGSIMYPLFMFLEQMDIFGYLELHKWIINKGKSKNEKIVKPPKSFSLAKHNNDFEIKPSIEASLSNNSEHMDTFKVDKMLFKGGCDDNCFDIVDFCTKWNDYYHNAGRYHGYSDVEHKINNENTIISTEIISDGTGECRSLYDVLLIGDRVNNISLTAKGGYGKTFILLQLADKIVSERKDILPFYIPLSELNSSTPNCIFDFIASKASELCCEGCSQKNLEDGLDSFSGTILFLFDGLNEITNYENRKNVLKSIINLLKWTQMRNNNLKMVVTSRYDFSSVFSDINESSYNNKFMQYKVNELSDSMIKNYLEETKCGISFETLPNEIKQLLRTPQGLNMYVCLTKSSTSRVEFRNLTELIGKYIEKTFDVSAKSKYDNALCKIGYIMVKNGSFRLHNNEYEDILDDENIDIDLFNREIKNENLIASANNFEIEFSHQNYRDYFCAKYIASIISRIRKESLENGITFLSAQDNTMNDEILGFVADLLGEYRFINGGNSGDSKVQNALSCISSISIDEQKSSEKIQSVINRLISIAKLGRNNDISGLVLNNLYLVNVSLNGCTLYQKQHSKKGVQPIQTTKFRNAVVCTETFVYSGIVGRIASINIITDNYLLITTYHYAYIYNIQSNNCKCIYTSEEELSFRVFGSFEIDGDKYIIIMDKNVLSFRKVDTDGSEVESIELFKAELNNDDKYCCYDNGRIFLLTKDGFIDVLYLNEKTEIIRRSIVKNAERVENYCVSNDYIYAAKHNEIYRAIISKGSDVSKFEFFSKVKTHIDDMCFVNEANSIFVCENGIMTSSVITRISERSKRIIATAEKEHDISAGNVFSGFGGFVTDGKRLFCGIYMDIVGNSFYPISDVCEIYYDDEEPDIKLLFVGHNLHNTSFAMGILSDDTIVAYSRSNSILFLNVDDESNNAKIYNPKLTGVGRMTALSEDTLLIGCLDGSLQKWRCIDTIWKCSDVWTLFSNSRPVSGYEPLEYGWKISNVGNKIYACLLGKQIVELQDNGCAVETIRKSDVFSMRILKAVAASHSGMTLIHVLTDRYLVLDENFTVKNDIEIKTSDEALLTVLGGDVYLTTVERTYYCSKSYIQTVVGNELIEIKQIMGIITSIDSVEYDGRKVIALTVDIDDYEVKSRVGTSIYIIYQNKNGMWSEWNHIESLSKEDSYLNNNILDSVILKKTHNGIRLYANKKQSLFFLEITFIDDELKVLNQQEYPVDHSIICSEALGDNIIFGDEDGKIHFFNTAEGKEFEEKITTEIGVISNYRVDLSDAAFERGNIKRLKGYFHLPD